MDSVDIAILKTIVYGDIFNFPMTAEEIHHFLIYDETVGLSTIQNQLETSPYLKINLCSNGHYYAISQCENLLDLRTDREQMMITLALQMTRYGRILAYFPFVELIGVTGALAMRNPSSANDDLDYLVIARPGRVWLARACIIILVRLMRLRNIEICPNYVLASDQLVQSRQDLYIAHEVAQMIPLSNRPLYQQFRDQNPWTYRHLPNASQPFHPHESDTFSKFGLFLKRGAELFLSSRIGNWLEAWEYRRKARRFEQEAQASTAAAEIDQGHVKGHFNDYGQHVLAQYQAKLETLEIESYDYRLESVGD